MNEIENLQVANAKRIFEASRSNDLVVFVGAGVSVNSGVPDWKELISELKNNLPATVREENDYLKVAQLFKEVVSSGDYLNSIQKVMKDGKTHPNPIHDAILQLDPCHIITTNYDNLIETAVENARCHYSVIRDDKDIPYANSTRYIIKMHGDFVSRKIVLTETDYYNYTSNYPLIDTLVKSIFASKTILCVGFSFNDLNLKIILNKIQSMLGNNAKPIYLLANYNQNPIFYSYLRNKGIQPFWLPCNVVKEYGQNPPTAFSSTIGEDTYKQLSCLRYDVSKPLDIIDALYSYSQMVEGEMPFFYMSRLRKILPETICKWYHTYSMGIQLESENIKQLTEECKTFGGKRKVLESRGDKIHSLIQTAANNCIFEFGSIKLWNMNVFKRCWYKKERDCCSMFLEFDFKALKERIDKLEQKELEYSNRDLELPFIKWIQGDIISAYELYESLERKYWASNNAILYFLCVYNKRAVFNGSFPLDSMPYEIIQSLFEKANNIDLPRVLSELSLDSRVKDNLSDLINNQYYVDALSSINRLENEIIEDKKLSEKGGFSINSHLSELLSKLTRNLDFSFVNYIITTNTGCAYETYRSGIIGLLNGHLIREAKRANGSISSSRIENIETSHLKLMLFTIDGKDLIRIFDTYKVNSITLDADAVEYLQNVIDNLLRDSSIIKKCLRKDILKNRVLGLLTLYWKANNQINKTSDIIDIVLSYDLLKNPIQRDFLSILDNIIKDKAYSLSERQCRELLGGFPEINITYGITSLMLTVSKQMKESGWIAENQIESINSKYLFEKQKLNEMYIYYDILPEQSKDSIKQYLKNLSKERDDVALLISGFIINKQLYDIADPELIEKLYSLSDNQQFEHRCYQTMQVLYQESTDDLLKTKIREYAASDEKLRFLLDPLSYNEDIDLSWLDIIKDDIFSEIIKRPSVHIKFQQQEIKESLLRRYAKLV